MEIKKKNTNWDNFVSLREYLERRISDLESKIDLTFKLNKIAIDKAEVKMNERLESMNEFRNALKDQTNKYTTRLETDIVLEKINDLKDQMNKRPTWLMTFVFLILSFLLGIVATYILK